MADLGQYVHAANLALERTGESGLIATGVYAGTALARALGQGTLRDHLRRPSNVAIGLAAGATALAINDPEAYRTLDTVQSYVGAGVAGFGVGAFAMTVAETLRSQQGIAHDLRGKVQRGAVRGMLAFPVGLGVANALSRYL